MDIQINSQENERCYSGSLFWKLLSVSHQINLQEKQSWRKFPRKRLRFLGNPSCPRRAARPLLR
jgi:hypothetical protein